MKLLVENDKQADAFLPVSWCIDAKTKETILEKRIVDPQVLLVTASRQESIYNKGDFNWTEESRELIPLNYKTVYVTFTRPGVNRIFATILGDEDGSTYELRKRVKKARTFVDRHGDFDPPEPYLHKTTLEVFVPEEFFAPEPPVWEKAYMRLWFTKDLPDDQCDWRKRRMFAYTLMPFLLLFWYIVQTIIRTVIYSAYFVSGSRNLYFRPIWDHSEAIAEIYEKKHASFGDSIFLVDSQGNRRLWTRAVHPILLTVSIASIALILIVLGYNYQLLIEMLREYWWAFALIIGVAMLMVVVTSFVLDRVWNFVASRWAEKRSKRLSASEKKELLLQQLLAKQRQTLDLMTCDSGSTGQSLSTFQSMVLTFQGVKSKVCRPFKAR